MAAAGNAQSRWAQLDGKRRGFIGRCEKYAGFTLPKLCTPSGYDQNSDELQHDFQAVGAQAVNHLANKIMLALFAPSRPFFRLDADQALKAELAKLQIDAAKLTELMSQGEKAAIEELDRMNIRPKLYEAVKHLIVLGNALMIIDPGGFRVVGIKNYCVRRSMSGKVLEILMVDKIMFDELEPAVQAIARDWVGANYANGSEKEVCLYKWIRRNAVGEYEVTQWVDRYQLPKEFSTRHTEEKLPYRVLTWDLSDDAHYGTGLVEDYQGDFAGLSTLSKAQIVGAVLASEFRWLVNPAGMTRPEDLMNSENGAALPGMKDDVNLVQSGKSQDLQTTMSMNAEYVTRIGRGFLLGSAVTRDAERVTAEEIRMQANELETSLGGAYSRLAGDFQIPMAYWLLDLTKFQIRGTGVKPTIVTGLAALSRNGDLENLKLWLADMAGLATLPEALLNSLDLNKVAAAFGAARRILTSDFMKSQEQLAAEQEARMQQEARLAAQTKGVDVAGNVAQAQATGATA